LDALDVLDAFDALDALEADADREDLELLLQLHDEWRRLELHDSNNTFLHGQRS
jgi:hypothetical protein